MKSVIATRSADPPGLSRISLMLVAFFRTGMKSIDRAHRVETEIATSTLPRIAFEYGQMA
jgi:hypothetical protein